VGNLARMQTGLYLYYHTTIFLFNLTINARHGLLVSLSIAETYREIIFGI